MGNHSQYQPPTAVTKVKTQLKRVPVGVFVGVALVIAALLLYLNTRHSEQRAETATNNVNRVADPILALCEQGGETAIKLKDAHLCEISATIKENPEVVTERPVDDEHIIALIDAELAKRPAGSTVAPSMDQLITAARAVINSNPEAFRGPAGPAAPSVDLASAIAAYVNGHPDQFRGPQGAQGAAGSTGTNGHDGAQGQAGPQGPAGPTGAAGPQGPQGDQGPAGADGAACPSGTGLESVTFADGRTGRACVDDGSSPTGTTDPTTVTETETQPAPTTDTQPPLITITPDPTGSGDSPGLTIPLPLLGR